MPRLTTIYSATPTRITPLPTQQPDALVRTHRIARDGAVTTLIERTACISSTRNTPTITTKQERIDASPITMAPRHLGLPRKSKATLAS